MVAAVASKQPSAPEALQTIQNHTRDAIAYMLTAIRERMPEH